MHGCITAHSPNKCLTRNVLALSCLLNNAQAFSRLELNLSCISGTKDRRFQSIDPGLHIDGSVSALDRSADRRVKVGGGNLWPPLLTALLWQDNRLLVVILILSYVVSPSMNWNYISLKLTYLWGQCVYRCEIILVWHHHHHQHHHHHHCFMFILCFPVILLC